RISSTRSAICSACGRTRRRRRDGCGTDAPQVSLSPSGRGCPSEARAGEGAMSSRVGTARRLRRDLTNAERRLWCRLRDRRLAGWKFRRQSPVDRFVVDFLCADARLIIEIDGGQHAERTREDLERTRVLEADGYFVLRFWNNDVMTNID